MMFGDPSVVVAEFVGVQDLLRDPRVHIAVRIGLGVGVRMRSEKNAEFHAPSWTIWVSAWCTDFSNAASPLRGAGLERRPRRAAMAFGTASGQCRLLTGGDQRSDPSN